MEWTTPAVFVIAITAGAVGGLWLARQKTNHAELSKHNDVAGVMFSIVGTLFTVLLAFIVVVVWETHGEAEERVAQEAGVLGDMIRDVGMLPPESQRELRQELNEYCRAVIEEEWPAMAKSESSPRVWAIVDQLFQSFSHLQPESPRDTNIHAELLTRLNELSDHRRLRLLSADDKIPGAMWAVLIGGALITVCFSYFLGVERGAAHALMTAALAAMIGLTIYLVAAIDHPFAGLIRITPESFQFVLDKVTTTH